MNDVMRGSRRLASLCAALLFAGAGCGIRESSTAEAPTPTVNATFYEQLRISTANSHPGAQVRLPASGEIFSENTKHFDLVPAAGVVPAATLMSAKAHGFAVYMPAGLNPVSKHAKAGAQPGSGIPGFNADSTPAECLVLAEEAQALCVDEARRKEHVSYHDVTSLAIDLGASGPASIADLTMRSLASHVGAVDQAAVTARLTDFVNDSAEHSAFNAAQHDIFNPQGYGLSHVLVTDNSRGDVDADGELESHSTLIVELRKSLQYARGAVPVVDACVAKYGPAFQDEYAVKVDAFVHLDHLKGFRRDIDLRPLDPGNPNDMTHAAQMARVNAIHESRTINRAWDANLLRHLAASTASFPWSASEYMIHFQVKPEIATKYIELQGAAHAAGDVACVDAIKAHVGAHTAIVTGKQAVKSPSPRGARKATLFFQVPQPSDPQAGACLHDELGMKVAILDPASGAVLPACTGGAATPSEKFTDDGACKNDPNNWAYGFSHGWARSPRFFTVQFIGTEWLLHDQVADHWRIQWWQDGWKALGQVAIKAAAYIISTYVKIQLGIWPGLSDFGAAAVYFVNVFMPALVDTVFRDNQAYTIAGWTFKIPTTLTNFMLGLKTVAVSNPTLIARLTKSMGGLVLGFAIDRATSLVVQMSDSMAFGWQDWSNGSHPGCFNFR